MAIKIVRAILPDPGEDGSFPAEYNIKLELSRDLTEFEERALRGPGRHDVLPLGGNLVVVKQTMIEQVKNRAQSLTDQLRDVEIQAGRDEAAYEAGRQSKQQIADSIDWPD